MAKNDLELLEPGDVQLSRQRSKTRLLWIPLIIVWFASIFLAFKFPWVTGVGMAACVAAGIAYVRRLGCRTIARGATIESVDGQLVVSEDGTTVHSLALDAVATGFYNDLDRVVIESTAGHELYIGCHDRHEAERIMEAANVSVDRRAMRITVGSVASRWAGGPAVGCVTLAVALLVLFVSLGGFLVELFLVGGGQLGRRHRSPPSHIDRAHFLPARWKADATTQRGHRRRRSTDRAGTAGAPVRDLQRDRRRGQERPRCGDLRATRTPATALADQVARPPLATN